MSKFLSAVKWKKFSDIVDCYLKIKILDVISRNDNSLNITAIRDQTKNNHQNVMQALTELVMDDILVLREYGRINIYSFNRKSERGILIRDFFEKWYNGGF